jgi:hypothetical protein
MSTAVSGGGGLVSGVRCRSTIRPMPRPPCTAAEAIRAISTHLRRRSADQRSRAHGASGVAGSGGTIGARATAPRARSGEPQAASSTASIGGAGTSMVQAFSRCASRRAPPVERMSHGPLERRPIRWSFKTCVVQSEADMQRCGLAADARLTPFAHGRTTQYNRVAPPISKPCWTCPDGSHIKRKEDSLRTRKPYATRSWCLLGWLERCSWASVFVVL